MSIVVERDGSIATVILNRPEKLNALTKPMWRELGETIDALSADDALRCVIVRGAGEKAFSPGNDIGEFANERSNKAQAIEYGRVMHATARALASCRHPLVAQIHGICVGGGLEIAALCDLRICGESSRFGAPIKNLGLVMAYPEMAPLVGNRATDRRRRAAGRALAQAVRATNCRRPADRPRRIRCVLRLLRHRGLPHRLRGVPREAQAELRRPMSEQPHPGPLAGMRVLELAQIMAGPTCGMMLADMGADVIKIEKLPGGDDARGYREPRVNGVSAPFLILNRNKRGIAVNLKHADGRAILLRLVRRADVLTENYRRGTLEKMGLGYDVLARENPGLIYCAVSGYGREGPYADKGGFDLIAQGFSGLMAITGEPGRPPVKTGNSVADINAGILAVVGVLAAYAHKQRTGEGQIVDTSLAEAALQQTYWHAAAYFATGQSPGPTGSAHLLTAPYQAFRAADGWINIGGANQANWERIAEVLGHSEWRNDPRFATNSDRMANLEALAQTMNGVLATRTKAEWIAAFDAAGVPVGPVHSIGEALTHPQMLMRGMVVETVHPEAGPTRSLGCPIHFSTTPTRVDRPAPLLGEHTRDVLREHGYDDGEIDRFVAEGIVESVATTDSPV